MDLINAVILSIVEGLTEFLPISSTGHLILLSNLLKLPQTEFLKSFEIFIQLGSISAVIILYFKDFLDTKKWPIIIAAFLPTAVFGFLFYGFVKSNLLENSMVVLISLFIGGILLIVIEKLHKEKNAYISSFDEISIRKAFLIGTIQAVSIIPGLSRAAATIIGGMLLGLRRKTAVEFSFVLAVPTMLAATSLDLVKSYKSFSPNDYQFLAVGFFISMIVATIAIKFLLKYVQNHDFIFFGIYRIIIALLFWIFIL